MLINIEQVIGKSLFAKRVINIRSHPSESATIIKKVNPGEFVGVLYSWLNPKQGRPDMWFMFYDENNKPYYTVSGEGLYDIRTLREQGTKTTEELVKEKELQDESFSVYVKKILPKILIGFAIVMVIGYLIKAKVK